MRFSSERRLSQFGFTLELAAHLEMTVAMRLSEIDESAFLAQNLPTRLLSVGNTTQCDIDNTATGKANDSLYLIFNRDLAPDALVKVTANIDNFPWNDAQNPIEHMSAPVVGNNRPKPPSSFATPAGWAFASCQRKLRR